MRLAHSIEVVVKELSETLEHIESNWLKDTHHLHVASYIVPKQNMNSVISKGTVHVHVYTVYIYVHNMDS